MDRGGAETYAMNQMRHLDTSKVQYDFLENVYDRDTSEKAYDAEIRERGGRIFRGPQYTKHPLAYARFFRELLRDHPEWHVVHGQFMKAAAPVYLGIARRMGRYTIAHSHNTKDGGVAKNMAMTAIRYPVRGIANHFFACSQEAGEYAFGKKIANSPRFEVATNGIDLSLYREDAARRQELRRSLGFDEGTFVVGHIGRFHPQKNHAFLVRVFGDVKKVKPEARLLLIGTGSLEEAVRTQVRELGLEDSVVFTGSIGNVPDYLRTMDVFLMPSLYEGLSVAWVEAQAAGLAVVMSDEVVQAGMRPICPENVRTVSLEADMRVWRDAVVSTLPRLSQPESSRLVSNAGYDISATTQRMEDFYLRAAESLAR